MENSVFPYPNVKSSSKYTFTVLPTHHTSMAWACSRAQPDDATSPRQCQGHSQSSILLYIHHDLTWARNIRVFCLETHEHFPGAFILTDCSQILEYIVHLNTEKLQEQQPFLTASWLPFLVSIFSPPFPLRNSCILPEGSLTSPKSHSDTSKCLLKGPVLSEGPKAQQTLPEHWPLWAYSPTALAHPHLSAFKSLCHLLISNYQIFQWNNLFLSSAHY